MLQVPPEADPLRVWSAVLLLFVESTCGGRFVPFLSKYEVRARQKAKCRQTGRNRLNFVILGEAHEESSIFEAKL